MTAEAHQHALYYNDDLVTNLQLRWGDGFLSPGGADELARMFRGIDVTGQAGLDVGCGVGGYDLVLVTDLGAERVVGVDLGPAVVAEAAGRARSAGLGDRLLFRTVEPGPLPFDDATFDFVFSKDTIADVPLADKPAMFAEMFRVCRPGGHLVVSDWFRDEAPYTEEMRAWATEGDETYEMDTLAGAGRYATDAGFSDVELDDRNDWFRQYAREEYERLKGPLFAEYSRRFGAAAARTSVENARVRALLAEQGQLRPGHVRARRPRDSD
ncbi:MAG: methyltransferase domain-containing protein [Halofilum sp. (in: g-proteobacteria)]|nr:methyltransferase domain-containing protein [Halofilum sp. (in: g-proteobacteria)]